MRQFAITVAAVAVCAVLAVSPAFAQDMNKNISPAKVIQIAPAAERTPEQMDAFEATFVAPGEREEPAPRSTIGEALLRQMKQEAGLAPRGVKPAPESLAPLASSTLKKFVGATECDGPGGCWVPPDVAGSIGGKQFVSVSNDVFEVHSRGGALQKTNSLNGLFGYSAQPMFDPRVQYDEEWQRWIITAPAFPESATVQILGLAVSQTSSANGKWWIYLFNVAGIGGSGSFYDYPQLGLSQDNLLFTANIFGASSFEGASLYAVAKARVYNGFGFSVPVFTGLAATLAPPHQLVTDQNPSAWFAAAQPGSGSIVMYRLDPGPSLHGFTVSGVAAYSVPPSAPQPAACSAGATLDTLDNRFQNTGTQSGDLYYQTHTVNLAGFAAPKYYVISGLLSSAPTVSSSNFFFASATSEDFNPSVAAEPNGNFAFTWSVTDPTNNVKPSVYFKGSSMISVFQSANCYNGSGVARWGDYSQTSVDPGTTVPSTLNSDLFWGANETVPSVNFWSTEVFKAKY